MYATVQVWVPCGPRARVPSRDILQGTMGSVPAELEPTRPIENPKTPFFRFAVCCCVPAVCICYQYQTNPQTLYTLTQPRNNSSRASSFPCVSQERFFCLCVIHGTSNNAKCVAISPLLCCLLLLCMYHPVLQALHTLWQPWHNSSRT